MTSLIEHLVSYGLAPVGPIDVQRTTDGELAEYLPQTSTTTSVDFRSTVMARAPSVGSYSRRST